MSAPLILGTNSIKDTAYNVANSLRLNDGDSPYLNKTPSSASNRRTFTLSIWAKRSDIDTSAVLFGAGTAATDMFQLLMQNDGGNNEIIVQNRVSGTNNLNLNTNGAFRDSSAWYHILLAVDTTQGTASNRAKLYVNGNQITSFSTETYPSQDYDCHVNNTVAHHVGAQSRGSPNDHFDGYITEFVLVDGSALTPTSFGEFDEDSNIWKPKSVSALTFGTNGFYLDFENSSSLGADVSGNSNNFTANNLAATDQSTDTCTNNFCTFNPLDVTGDEEPTFSEGNLISVADGAFHQARSTFYLTKGKWFWEFKFTSIGDAAQGGVVGSNYAGGSGLRRNYSYNGQKYTDGSSSSYGATYAANDIVSVALDLDNGTLVFYKNGASQGTAYTDMLSNMGQDGWTPDIVFFNSTVNINFGSPPYSESGGNSDANGFGNFSMAVPSGFFACNTKNLAEYG